MKAIYICDQRHSKQSMQLLFVTDRTRKVIGGGLTSDKSNSDIVNLIQEYIKKEGDIDLLSDDDIQGLINNNQTQNRDENFMIENVELL